MGILAKETKRLRHSLQIEAGRPLSPRQSLIEWRERQEPAVASLFTRKRVRGKAPGCQAAPPLLRKERIVFESLPPLFPTHGPEGARLFPAMPAGPLDEDGCPEKAADRPEPPKDLARSRSVLLVEDHEHTRIVLTKLLTRDSYLVHAVGTYAEAVAAFKIGTHEILISDVRLPDGNGLDLVRELKDLAPGLFAVALSGYGSSEDIRKSLAAGFWRHLTKPITIERLRAALQPMAS